MVNAKMKVINPTMKVVEMDLHTLRNYVNGCVQNVLQEKKADTWINGSMRGIDDGLQVVDEKDLTYIMKMALLGMRHQYDKTDMNDYYTKIDTNNYQTGYKLSLRETIKLVTGEEIKLD